MAAARLSSAISSTFLSSRASSITCWPSSILRPGLLQLEHHRRLDDVDADRHLGDAGSLDERGDLLGVALHQAEGGIDGAAQADEAGLAVLRLEPGRVELVVHGGRAEVPQDRLAVAGEQRPAAELVALPLADLGRGEVADVVDVEDQQRAEVGFLQRLLDAARPVAVQAAVVDPLLEIDPHGAERRQRAAPVVARVDVLGAGVLRRVFSGVLWWRCSCWGGGGRELKPVFRCESHRPLA